MIASQYRLIMMKCQHNYTPIWPKIIKIKKINKIITAVNVTKLRIGNMVPT